MKRYEILNTLPSEDYTARVEQQINQYASTLDIHVLPDSFHYWSHNYIRPALESVFNVQSVAEFYADGFAKSAMGLQRPKFLSIGCGDGWLEIEVAKILKARGLEFDLIGADIAPNMLERFSSAIPPELVDNVFPVEHDLNSISIDGRFNGIMANHSLHHFIGLEHIFDFVRERLDGVFITNDMIGRNGHMRWPETLAVMRGFWPLLSKEQKTNLQLSRYEERLSNHDCSTEGFEGIRAQDILPLLKEKFCVRKFVAVGGFIDLLVDRGFGHSFNMKDECDVSLIRSLCELNDMMLDADMIKPTIMFGYFDLVSKNTVSYRDRTPDRSVRRPDARLAWTQYYDSED